MFQEVHRAEATTLIHSEPQGAETKPSSPECQGEVCAPITCCGTYISLTLKVNLMNC